MGVVVEVEEEGFWGIIRAQVQNGNRMGEGDFSLWRGLSRWGHQPPVLHWGLLL